ncbi:hypothetical protein Tco_0806809 [Tanacetum coccineum]
MLCPFTCKRIRYRSDALLKAVSCSVRVVTNNREASLSADSSSDHAAPDLVIERTIEQKEFATCVNLVFWGKASSSYGLRGGLGNSSLLRDASMFYIRGGLRAHWFYLLFFFGDKRSLDRIHSEMVKHLKFFPWSSFNERSEVFRSWKAETREGEMIPKRE